MNPKVVALATDTGPAGICPSMTCEDEPHICDDDDTSAACNVTPDCDLSLNFDTMADLSAASGSFPNQFIDYHALGVLGSMLSSALTNYSAVNSGYDAVFGDYVTYTKEMVPVALSQFIAPSSKSEPEGGAGNKYFKCVFHETVGSSSDITYNPCPVSNSLL